MSFSLLYSASSSNRLMRRLNRLNRSSYPVPAHSQLKLLEPRMFLTSFVDCFLHCCFFLFSRLPRLLPTFVQLLSFFSIPEIDFSLNLFVISFHAALFFVILLLQDILLSIMFVCSLINSKSSRLVGDMGAILFDAMVENTGRAKICLTC